MRVRKLTPWLGFLDVIMNGFIAITALYMISLTQMNPEATEEPVLETLGKYVVVMTWEDDSDADVDLYVRDPNGNIAFYSTRDTGLMNLEYDDLGSRSDRVTSSSIGTIALSSNQERVILRGVVPGEYVVNVQMYSLYGAPGADVKVRLHRLRGADALLYEKSLRLEDEKEEKTAFRFTVTVAEDVTDINELPVRLAGGRK